MEKRNLTPLRNVLVRYLVVCGGGSLVILLVWWGLFMSLIRNGFLLPPVTGAQVCSEARDYAATATVETFDPNAIDPLCRYAILQAGTAHVLQTNMTASQLKKARNILTGGRQWVVASYQYYQYVVDMADGARCILQYDYSVPYADPALREVLPDFQTMYILLLILLEVIWLALCTHRTVKVLARETRKLTKATAAIAAQRPEEIEVSGAKVREFAETLRAMQTMGSQLTASLQSQWKLEQQRAEQTAALAHDLKTPLTVILSSADLMQQTDVQPDQQPYVDNIRWSGRRMKRLVEDMLTLSRADDGRLKAAMTPVDLSDAMEDTALRFEPVAFEAGRRLDYDIAPGIAVTGSRDQLQQVAGVLLDNAIKYAPQGAQVRMTLVQADRKAVLTVENGGPPIPAEVLPHLFERFYRADGSRTQGGFGLGLSLIHI